MGLGKRVFAIVGGSTPSLFGGGAALIRVAFGATLALAHGMGKLPPAEGFVAAVGALGFPLPGVFAWAAGLAEFAGGLLLAVGLLTRPAAAFVAFTMGVAFFGQHAGDPFGAREMALLYGVVALGFLIGGSGPFGLDALLGQRRGAVVSSGGGR
jgi:putative oxidoreductase